MIEGNDSIGKQLEHRNTMENTQVEHDQDDNEDIEAKDTKHELVDWKNPPKLSDLQQNYQDALPTHNAEVAKVERYLDNLYIRNGAKITPTKGHSAVQPKMIRKQAEWRYPALSEPFLSMDDLFSVSPVTWEDGAAARQNQLLLNNQFNTKIDRVRFIDKYVRTLVNTGTAILQTGWCYEEGTVKELRPVVQYIEDPDYAPMHEELAGIKENDPDEWAVIPEELKIAHQMTLEGGIPIRPEKQGDLMEEVEVTKVLKNHPTVEVCNFRNTVIDPTAGGDIKKAQFVVKSFDSNLSRLKKNGRYVNLDKIRLTEASPLSMADHDSPGSGSGFNFLDDPRKLIVVREYYGLWDIDGTGITKLIICAWVNDTCIRLEELPYSHGTLPFEIVHYMPSEDENTGEPDGALLVDNQAIAGAITRGLIDSLGRSANAQTGMRKDMLDASNKLKFERGQDYMFNSGVDPRQGVYHHTYPEIPQSASFMLQLMNFEAESLTGVKSFNEGVNSGSLGDVAAGIRGALDAASKRELSILRRMKEGLIAVARRFIAMNAEMLNDEEVIRVTNEEFVTVRRDDLPGSFDLKLNITTAEEDNSKAEQLAFILQTMGPDSPPGLRNKVLGAIMRLRKMPDLAHEIENFKPEPDPVQQRLAELEMAIKEAELQKIQAEIANLSSTAQLNQVKQGTEQAKAANLMSDTDNKNLEFVETESGVKQQRDLQKIGEQARSQADLRRVDHEMKKEEDKNKLLTQYKLLQARKK
jgi:hypothetical protein